MLSSAWSSSGALSGTPTNVTLSVAHNDESINANAPIVAANSATCATTRAVGRGEDRCVRSSKTDVELAAVVQV